MRKENNKRLGIWLAGALGDIATTLVCGCAANRRGLCSSQGMVTALPLFEQLDLVDLSQIVFGGLDVRSATPAESAEHLYRESRTLSREILDAIQPDLEDFSRNLLIDARFDWRDPARRGDAGLSELYQRLVEALAGFRRDNALDRVVVVDLTSAEAPADPDSRGASLARFRRWIADNERDRVAPSQLLAMAAIDADCAYLNFTPNPGIDCTALTQWAEERRLPYYGNDGKTGETLVKSVLAPMFVCRNLHVMSWEGTNLLGNADGRALDDPQRRRGKLDNKGGILEQLLGYPAHSGVDINYVPSLGDWKTAWDLIHFKGFLDVPMTMQFTWQGCDSVLAAPLVLDMARLAELALRRGESGPMTHLACFFKNPMRTEEAAFHAQFQRLLDYTARASTRQSA